MPRPKKDGHYVNAYIKTDLYNELDRISKITGQSKTVALEWAIQLYSDKINKQKKTATKKRSTAS